jgi:ribosomal protein L37AE/L43A
MVTSTSIRSARPAAPEDCARWAASIRAGLRGSAAPRRAAPPVRARPACSACGQDSVFFVRRDVHLCDGCVDLLAAGALVPRADVSGPSC